MACRDSWEVSLSCPECDADLAATYDQDQMTEFAGCHHAEAYVLHALPPLMSRQMERALDRAYHDAARDALDDADESRYDAWEGRRDDA